jgi:hypothetical protein
VGSQRHNQLFAENKNIFSVRSINMVLPSRSAATAGGRRFAHPRAMGRNVGDEFMVPLRCSHRRQLHQTGNDVS